MAKTAKKILLAEDDALIAGMYSEALKASGFTVELAFDGEEAIKKLDEMYAAHDLPAVALLDIMMPKKNGLEVLMHIKRHNPMKYTPVIMLTNLSGTTDVDRALEAGAVMYLVKVENTPRQIAAKVREIADSYNQNKGKGLTVGAGTETGVRQ